MDCPAVYSAECLQVVRLSLELVNIKQLLLPRRLDVGRFPSAHPWPHLQLWSIRLTLGTRVPCLTRPGWGAAIGMCLPKTRKQPEWQNVCNWSKTNCTLLQSAISRQLCSSCCGVHAPMGYSICRGSNCFASARAMPPWEGFWHTLSLRERLLQQLLRVARELIRVADKGSSLPF